MVCKSFALFQMELGYNIEFVFQALEYVDAHVQKLPVKGLGHVHSNRPYVGSCLDMCVHITPRDHKDNQQQRFCVCTFSCPKQVSM